MEENVALDSSKQKQFVKSLKGIKKLIKKNDADDKSKRIEERKTKDGKIRKKKKHEKGLVYLSHIPHGFYEHEMTQYFKQFGVVTNSRVIRSKRTGNSKGYAFVEFKEPTVAQIVADTMNNYLMGKRLIKAKYIPPEKQRSKAMRKHWNSTNNPGVNRRLKMKKAYNADKDEKGDLDKAKKILSNLSKTKKKLSELGINYDFFTPVDIPEKLLSITKVKQEKEEDAVEEENVSKTIKKKKKKSEALKNENKEEELTNKVNKKGKKNAINIEETKEQAKKSTKINKSEDSKKISSKHQEKQKQKNHNLKDKGVKPLEDFIQIKDEDDDTDDSSYIFDSDEYDKAIENEDDINSNTSNESDDDFSGSDESNQSNNDVDLEDESDSESVEDLPPVKKNKSKAKPTEPSKTVARQNVQLKRLAKRKLLKADADVKHKKAKFEKKNKQKQFKKRK